MSEAMRIAAVVAGAVLWTGAAWLAFGMLRRARSAERLWPREAAGAAGSEAPDARERYLRWLAGAGMRGAGAPRRFALAQLAALGAGALVAILAGRLAAGSALPGSVDGLLVVGPLAGAVLALGPLALGAGVAAMPALAVRARRRARLDAIAAELPLALELLAALSEAGLSFDASLARLLDEGLAVGPLGEELAGLRRDAAAGLRRTEALRRFGARIELPLVRGVVATLVQAEEIGSGVADALRPLAEDLRQARRERALARVESLPNRLAVALAIGFLPGLLFWTLGPAFHRLFAVIDAISAR